MGSQISSGDVVRRVWDIYRDQFPVLAGGAAIIFAVQFVIALLLSSSLALVVAVLFWVLSTLYQGMVVELVSDVRDGRRDHSVGDLLRSVEPVLFPLMVVSLLLGIGVAIGFVLLIIPGLILLTIWSVVAPVMVLERPGILRTFGRSRELVRGNGWAVFGVIVILYLLVVLVSLLAGAVASGLGSGGRALVQFVVTIFIAPIPALGASVLYFQLRGGAQEFTPSAPS